MGTGGGEHDGTDAQHAIDVGTYKQGEAKGLSFSEEELRCARYAKGGSEKVVFAAVSMMEAGALHDYASKEGGAQLQAATEDEELAERAVRFRDRRGLGGSYSRCSHAPRRLAVHMPRRHASFPPDARACDSLAAKSGSARRGPLRARVSWAKGTFTFSFPDGSS